jgi:hypothetical protein
MRSAGILEHGPVAVAISRSALSSSFAIAAALSVTHTGVPFVAPPILAHDAVTNKK